MGGPEVRNTAYASRRLNVYMVLECSPFGLTENLPPGVPLDDLRVWAATRCHSANPV
jgi:hypothetical protein